MDKGWPSSFDVGPGLQLFTVNTFLFVAASDLAIATNLYLLIYIGVKLLKTKRHMLYVRNLSAPRCKHFPLRL